jgi:hypothetical protein
MWPLSPEWQDPLTAPGHITTSRAGLRVRLLGDEAARGVAFIHGVGASLRYWGTAYDRLAGRSTHCGGPFRLSKFARSPICGRT